MHLSYEFRYNKNPYYMMYFKLFLTTLIAGAVIVASVSLAGIEAPSPGVYTERPSTISLFFVALIYIVALTIVSAIAKMMKTNIFYNGVRLLKHRVNSQVKGAALTNIMLTNTLLTIITLGFYYPWAKVRLSAFFAEALSVTSTSSLDDFVQNESGKIGATGAEVGEFFDIGFSLGG